MVLEPFSDSTALASTVVVLSWRSLQVRCLLVPQVLQQLVPIMAEPGPATGPGPATDGPCPQPPVPGQEGASMAVAAGTHQPLPGLHGAHDAHSPAKQSLVLAASAVALSDGVDSCAQSMQAMVLLITASGALLGATSVSTCITVRRGCVGGLQTFSSLLGHNTIGSGHRRVMSGWRWEPWHYEFMAAALSNIVHSWNNL